MSEQANKSVDHKNTYLMFKRLSVQRFLLRQENLPETLKVCEKKSKYWSLEF